MKIDKHPYWLVTKDIAKKLKEIGYNEANYFELNEEGKVVIEIDSMEDSYIIDVTDLIVYKNEYWHNASVPTWTEVLEWFRKRGFYSYIKKKSFPERYIYYIDYGMTTYSKENLRDDLLPKTYEEAREEMVEKLIELYKNSNNIKNEK